MYHFTMEYYAAAAAPPPSNRLICIVVNVLCSKCIYSNSQNSQYWRFSNDKMDAGYPKPIIKGFGGLNGRITAALSVAKHKNRPESVYFFKKGTFHV